MTVTENNKFPFPTFDTVTLDFSNRHYPINATSDVIQQTWHNLSLRKWARGQLEKGRQTAIQSGKRGCQTQLLMRHLWENSHLKHNNSNEKHFFIMFLTLKSMPENVWEQCQVGVSYKSGECVWGKMGCGSSPVKGSQCTWHGSGALHCHCLFKCALQWRKTGHVDKTDCSAWSDTWFFPPTCMGSAGILFLTVTQCSLLSGAKAEYIYSLTLKL